MVNNREMPGHLARRFQQIAVSIFHAEMEANGYDLTPVQFAALAAIDTNPGIDQVTLAGLIAHDRTTIGGVIDRLDRKELVVREISPTDRRARTLRITDKGQQMLGEVEPIVLSAQQEMLVGLSPDEAESLVHLLAKAIDATNERSRAPLRKSVAP